MAKCKNCGAEVKGKFCAYCGTEINYEETKKTTKIENVAKNKTNSENTNLSGFTKTAMGAFDWLGKMNDLLKMTSNMKDENRQYFNDEEMQVLNSMNSISLNILKQNDEMGAEIKNEKQRQRNARRAIASGHCPECGNDIKKSTEHCPKCGADCLMEAYSDL